MFFGIFPYEIIFIPLLTAFLLTAVLTPLTLIGIKKIGLFDDPSKHKHPAILHKKPVPRGGGIPLFLGVLIAALFFLPITPHTIAIFLSGTIALGIGILDDKLDVSPYLRFAINILTATIVVGSGISMHIVTNPLGGIIHLDAFRISITLLGTPLILRLSDILAIGWIVWVMNMLNWSKGVDGQMPGIVAISAIVIGLLSMRFPLTDQNTYSATILAFLIAGSMLGFLLYNFYPAKIFPGYGATAIYVLLASISLLSGAKLATAILVMGVPMIDGIVTVGRRIISGKSPFWHDKKHLHHLLLKLGLSQRNIALFYWILSAILGVISLSLSSKGKLFAIIMIIILVGGAILTLHLMLRSDDEESI